jgi:transcription elongation GreA/GreB family factor
LNVAQLTATMRRLRLMDDRDGRKAAHAAERKEEEWEERKRRREWRKKREEKIDKMRRGESVTFFYHNKDISLGSALCSQPPQGIL